MLIYRCALETGFLVVHYERREISMRGFTTIDVFLTDYPDVIAVVCPYRRVILMNRAAKPLATIIQIEQNDKYQICV